MTDFNIEFAHIYANAKFGKEQMSSITVLNSLIEKLKKDKKSFSTAILIDEFSSSNKTLNEASFLRKIRSNAIELDFLAYESRLVPLANKVIKLIPKKLLRKENFNGKKVLLLEIKNKRIGLKDKHGRPTCSLLVTAWILARFGVFSVPGLKKFSSKTFKSDRLINILPEKYRETERKVLDILRVTKHKALLNKIEYVFY